MKSKSRQLIVVEPGRIELQELDVDAALEPHQALVEAEYSIVSAGTEGAGFTGLVREMPFGDGGTYPRGTGYGHLGRVLEVGSAVEMCRAGDRVLSFSRHASLVKADAARMALPVPKDAAGSHLVFARMAGVSISALRSSSVQPGDTVLVIGMGLVGNFAAQLFRMAGAEVMAVDLSDYRLEKARACGIERTVNSGVHDLQERCWSGPRARACTSRWRRSASARCRAGGDGHPAPRRGDPARQPPAPALPSTRRRCCCASTWRRSG